MYISDIDMQLFFKKKNFKIWEKCFFFLHLEGFLNGLLWVSVKVQFFSRKQKMYSNFVGRKRSDK